VLRWYVYSSKPNAEFAALDRLKRQSFEAWVPVAKERAIVRGRVCYHRVPLFRGYGFVRFDIHDSGSAWEAINNTRSVQSLLPLPERPMPLDNVFVETLRAEESAGRIIFAGVPVAGDTVRVRHGRLLDQVLDCVAVNDRKGVITALWHCFGSTRPVDMPLSDVSVEEHGGAEKRGRKGAVRQHR
jgi:transcriptional antiterminator RfaH